MTRLWVLLLVPACFRPSYEHTACGPAGECPGALMCVQGFCELGADGGTGDLDGALASDGSIQDGAVDGSNDAQSCFGVGLVNVCLATLPDHPVSLPRVSGTLDTTQAANCDLVVAQQAGPSLCVIVGTSVTVSGSLVAIGPRPLVLVATDTVTVIGSGTLDVSSVGGTGARRGAGGNASECFPSSNGANDSGGAGGGGGGGFGTTGGQGGSGDLDDSNQPVGPAFGGAGGEPQSSPIVLHGGCSGGAGGSANTDPRNRGGPGGDGGGVVYLIAGNRIAIDGNVFASGAGGGVTSGTDGRLEGGGGGGSGGMIGLDAPMIQVAGRVVANGGAGGGGGANVGGTPGGNGTTVQWNLRAAAGVGAQVLPTSAGNGAEGTAVGATANIDGVSTNLGGGGGAGGLGLIFTYGTLSGGSMMSPAPVQR
jgi:hypothetical protein